MEERYPVPLHLVFARGTRTPLATPGSIADMLPEADDAHRAVIFVHGFTGTPIETWNQFQQVIQYEEAYWDADIFYYGYPSMTRQTTSLANDFRYFMEAINDGAVTRWLGDNGIEDSYGRHMRYEEILVVAHSLGGAVVRQAMIYAAEDNAGWLPKCRLSLFAPAHCGARLSRYGTSIIGLIPSISKFEGLLKYYIQPADELHPDSKFVAELKARTAHFADIYTAAAPGPFRARCVFGKGERIVVSAHYPTDRRYPEVPGKDHTSVCKPTMLWKWPTLFILPEAAP